ncbi:MAG: endonuclease/exonuclease/phosphatase family protein [Ignavibacteriaceae bacterium]|jgi:endonuclease/exonuclease/phosphatase family metal-dependent hydrolase
MKINKLVFSSLLLLFFVITTSVLPQSLRVMTFNIRLDSPNDGENIWDKRKDNFVSMIRFHKADIVGLQEAQKHQIDYIQQSLPEYSWFGIGRDDGKAAGEFTAIFYRKDRFDTLETTTFWCSVTPDHPGLGWDAAYQRITTYGKFKDNITGNFFYLFNTHLDNEGEVARLESAKLIKKKMEEICCNFPIIFTGDFNSFPDSPAYKVVTAKSDLNSSIELFDSESISQTKHHGPGGTFTGFDILAKPAKPIDFIFVKKGISVLSHGTLSDSFDGFLPSDHYAVLAEILLNN